MKSFNPDIITMGSNSFLVRLNIKENRYSGKVSFKDCEMNMSFRRILNDIFLCTSKNDTDWRLLDEWALIRKNKKMTVLLPVQGSFNKRKYLKVVKYINSLKNITKFNLLICYQYLEKIFSVHRLLNFFELSADDALSYLLEEEMKKNVKLIEINKLIFCSYQFFNDASEKMKGILLQSHSNRKKVITAPEFEKHFRLNLDNIFLKYLIRKNSNGLNLKIMQNRVVFEDLPLTDEEERNIREIITVIKKNRINIFSISQIMKKSGKSYDEINVGLWNLLSSEKIIQLDEKKEYFIFSEELARIINRLKKYKRNEGDILDISAVREITDFNRKNIIILLEYLDSKKITVRLGNNKRRLEIPV